MSTRIFGRVPLSNIIPDTITTSTAWDDTGQRTPRFVVLTRLLDALETADDWFRHVTPSPSLIDYGLNNTTGQLVRWNDPLGRRSPWANGPWMNPPGPGRVIVATYGIEAINRDGISIGIAGGYDDPISNEAYQRLVQLIAWHADQAHVPPTIPDRDTDDLIHPETGVSFVLWHDAFCGDITPDPGPVIKALTPHLIADVRMMLELFQLEDSPLFLFAEMTRESADRRSRATRADSRPADHLADDDRRFR